MFRVENLVKTIGLILFFCALLFPLRPLKRLNADQFDRIANALEAYAVDNGGRYPSDRMEPALYRLPAILTSPIAYLTSADLIDPLNSLTATNRFIYINVQQSYLQSPSSFANFYNYTGGWLVASAGYDRVYESNILSGNFIRYDATNGTISKGDIIRTKNNTREVGNVPGL